MPIEPIKIPQNVYIEDRIVGPITLRQIMIIGVGAGISYVIYGSLSNANGGGLPLPLTIICWIPAAISAAFAFVKINDLSLFRIMLLMIERINKPAVRAFYPRQGFSIHIRTFNAPPTDTRKADPSIKTQQYQRIDALTDILDSPLRRAAEDSLPPSASADEQEIAVRDVSAPAESETEDGAQASALPRLPVNRERIKAAPLESPEGEPHASVSIFRDIVPK